MLRREMTLGRVGSGGSGGPIRVARGVPLVLRACPWCRVFPLRVAQSPFPVSRDIAHLRLGGHGAGV